MGRNLFYARDTFIDSDLIHGSFTNYSDQYSYIDSKMTYDIMLASVVFNIKHVWLKIIKKVKPRKGKFRSNNYV